MVITMFYIISNTHILVVSSTGTITYNEVTAFLKRQPNILMLYKSIATTKETIILTGNHLIYARKTLDDQFNSM